MRSRPIGNGLCAPRVPRWFAALMDALRFKTPSTSALLDLTHDEWDALLRLCDLAHLTLPLSQVSTAGFPRWVADRLRTNVADNAARFERVKATYREAAKALDGAGVEHIVLKGFTQVPEYVAEPRLRMQSDLDFYCPPESIEHARRALTRIDYESEQTVDYSRADHLPSLTRRGNWQWRGNAFDPEMPLSIELHFCLWNERTSSVAIPELDGFWDRRVKRALEDISYPALSPVDQLGHLSLHVLRNLIQGDWIVHHVLELAAFLHRHAEDNTFWSEWRETHSSELRSIQSISFAHAIAWFDCDVHSDVERQIIEMPATRRRWIDKFASSALENMFRRNKNRLWLHVELVTPPYKKLEIICRTILPTQLSRLPRPGAAAVTIRNREQKHPRISNKYLQCFLFIARLAFTYLRTIPGLLWNGMSLWLFQWSPGDRTE